MGLTKNYLLESEMYSEDHYEEQVEECYLDEQKGITMRNIWTIKSQTKLQS